MVPFSFKSERAYSFVPCIKFQVSGGRSQKSEVRRQKSGGRESREEREGLSSEAPVLRSLGEGGSAKVDCEKKVDRHLSVSRCLCGQSMLGSG